MISTKPLQSVSPFLVGAARDGIDPRHARLCESLRKHFSNFKPNDNSPFRRLVNSTEGTHRATIRNEQPVNWNYLMELKLPDAPAGAENRSGVHRQQLYEVKPNRIVDGVLETVDVTFGWGIYEDGPNHGEGQPPLEGFSEIRYDVELSLDEAIKDFGWSGV